ncbi:hypothetical protein AK812_SmicGene1449 [Symbiodinium microadriaticum]|uniref:Calmodulin n=2 Tax=Symbiodinium TaxID=2949 RepID=A0A1Q9F411_SYMMI|nr:hypothetical protein AK812_SmicGene1449 [Symbiodinium microadriaticum]
MLLVRRPQDELERLDAPYSPRRPTEAAYAETRRSGDMDIRPLAPEGLETCAFDAPSPCEEAALLEAIATPKAAQNSQPELPEEVGFFSPTGVRMVFEWQAAEKPLTPEKKADKDEAGLFSFATLLVVARHSIAGLELVQRAALRRSHVAVPSASRRTDGAKLSTRGAREAADANHPALLGQSLVKFVELKSLVFDGSPGPLCSYGVGLEVMDEMSGETRPLTSMRQAERAGEKSERKDGREGGGKAETADDAAHIQRLGVYFGLKGLKGKIRFKLYEERVALLVRSPALMTDGAYTGRYREPSPIPKALPGALAWNPWADTRVSHTSHSLSGEASLGEEPWKYLGNRIAFGLLDVGGDGVVGRRDVFAALASARSEDTAYNESLDAVFTSPGSYGIHFADSDTPSLLVVGVVPASPAENQGVRVGHRLSRINGISVDKLTTQEVRTLLMNPSRPLSMTFRYRIFDLRDLKRLLEALATDHVTRRVKIFVEKAKNLKAVEQHLLNSHPYCQVCEQMNPEWNEEREQPACRIADFAIGETLRFTVRDKDFGTKEPPPVKADSYCTCEIAGSKKSQSQRPWQTKTVTDSLDPAGCVDELLGSYEMPSSQFWPGGFDGEVTLTQEEPLGPLEHSRRDKKSTVTLKVKVTTPESAAILFQPEITARFASAVKPAEPGSNQGAAAALERFEDDEYLPFGDYDDDDDDVSGEGIIVPVWHRRLFEAVSPKGSPVGILEWAQFLERYRNGDWYSLQERIHLTFALYDLDGDGMLSLADAISLSREVERLELIYGKDGGHDGGQLDLQVFKQLRPNPSLTQDAELHGPWLPGALGLSPPVEWTVGHVGDIDTMDASVIMQIMEVKDPRDISSQRLYRYWQEVDTDASGNVSFQEFLSWMLTKGPEHVKRVW